VDIEVKMSKKLMILDTNVLLTDPRSIFKFQNNDVLIPMIVLEEVDNFKKENGSLGFSSREIARLLDGIRKRGSLHAGVELEEGGVLKVDYSDRLPTFGDVSKNDNIILQTAIDYQTEVSDSGEDYEEVILVSKDTNLRVKADALGVIAQDYRNDQVKPASLKEGAKVFEVCPSIISTLYSDGATYIEDLDMEVNEYAIFKAGTSSALVRRKPSLGIHLVPADLKASGVSPRNAEQRFLLDALLDPSINMVALHGSTGSGKTLLSTAAAIEQVLESNYYEKIIIARPTVSMGADLGYLPGSLAEKLAPWTAPFFDACEVIFKSSSKDVRKMKGLKGAQAMGMAQGVKPIDYLIETGLIEFESLQHIRGRSFRNCFIIIDEAQNLTLHEAKTIITRVGEDSKIVFQGDLDQIDVPYLDKNSSGLAHLLSRLRGQDIVSCPVLTKTERSKLAELAGELL
jgi:PhoH-like ATPase